MTDRPIVLDADFDSGSLNTAASSVDGDTVHLVGRDNFNTGCWKWLHFSADHVKGRALTFQIADHFDTDPNRLNDHRMVYSHDGELWSHFDFNGRDPAAGLYRFGNHRPFTSDRVFVAYGLPYPFSRVMSHMDRVRSSPWVSPTGSSDAQLVLGMSPGGVDDLGRTIQPHELYGYQITDAGAQGPKKTIVLMSGVHPNETLANHVLEALIDWLIGGSDQAAALRRRARFLVYPMANPDGRAAGYNRSTVQHVGRDANRFWREDLWRDMGDIATVGGALIQDTGGSVDYFIDLHCWTDTRHHVGILCKEEGYWDDPFWRTMLALEPGLATWDSGWANPSTETLAFKRLNAGFCMTFELMYLPAGELGHLRRIGGHLGEALHQAVTRGSDDA
jgi:Zinc carboxypeptidase/Cytosolic carboxypeptidase N-terminal domain